MFFKRAKPLSLTIIIIFILLIIILVPLFYIPGMTYLLNSIIINNIETDTSGSIEKLMDRDYIISTIIYQLTNINAKDPTSILACELNFVSLDRLTSPTVEESGEEDFYLPGQEEELKDWIYLSEDDFPPVQLDGEYMVLLYNTHNAEAYKPSQGVSRLEGKNAGVFQVSKTMAQALESKHSLKTYYSDIIHDYPDFAKSYINSMYTAKKLLQQYTKVQAVLDIHRDAGLKSREDTLVKINNKNCAKIMIVVGTEHENWRNNLAFAQKIKDKADELYPGLIKTIRLCENRRYNQHLHPRALLLEFGGELNTQEDADNSAILMADVLADVLVKGKQ